MKNNNGKHFIWGDYDYSEKSSKENSFNISNIDSKEEKKERNYFNPIKAKIKEGIEKIKTSELANKLSSKLSFNEKQKNDIQKKNYSSSYNYDYEDNFQLKCKIDEYKDRVIGIEHVIFYKIELSSSLSQKNWEVYRSLEEFKNLYLIYKKLFLDAPYISWPDTTKLIKEPIIHRQLISDLDKYMNEILEKPGLLTPQFLVEFLELKNHYYDLTIYKPLLRYDSNSDEMYSNKLSINDIIFLEEPKLLLVGTGVSEGEEYLIENNDFDNNNSKFNFLNKIGKIFNYNKGEKSNLCRGKFYIYNLIKNNNFELMMVEIKCLEVISQIIKISFFSEKNILTLGLNNGQILIFELYIKQLNPNSKDILEYIGTINYHTTPPICCLFNFKENYIYSISYHDTSIKICEFNYQNLIKELNIYNENYKKSRKNKGIICVDYTISYEYIYIQDDEGNIFFIDIISDPSNPNIISFFPKFLKNENNFEGEKNKGKIIKIKNCFYLFIGENDSYNKKNKNKTILNIYLILINDIYYNDTEPIQLIKMREIDLNGQFYFTDIHITNKYEILISFSNGSLCVYNHSNKYPEYYFIYHYQKITKFIWLEQQKTIISASYDKSIKIYQIPLILPADLIRKDKKINDIKIIKDMIEETRNIFCELEHKSYNSYYEESNTNKNDNEVNSGENDTNNNIIESPDIENKKVYKNIWDIGNLDFNRYETTKNKNFIIKNDEDDNIDNKQNYYYDNDNRNNENEYNFNFNKNNIDFKIDKYVKYFNIFSDDLDGWSA